MVENSVNPPIILDDLLTYVFCKLTICPKDTLIAAVAGFYSKSDIKEARDKLFNNVPSPEGAARRVKHQDTDKMLSSIYNILQELPTESAPIFAATNISNLPQIDLKNVDGASLVYQQDRLQGKVEGLIHKQDTMQSHMASMQSVIDDLLNKITNSTDSNVADNRQRLSNPGSDNAVGSSRTTYAGTVKIPVKKSQEKVSNQSSQKNQSLQSNIRNGGERSNSLNVPNMPDNLRVQTSAKKPRKVITGTKTGTTIRVAATANKSRIFVSRLAPDLETKAISDYVTSVVGVNSSIVMKLKTRLDHYSSFVICCDDVHKDKLADPNEWEKGVLIRPYFGNLPSLSNHRND